MAYATYSDVEVRLGKTFDDSERSSCNALLDDAAVIVDAYNKDADVANKKLVSVKMVIRAIGTDGDIPIGATQGTMSALGYSQTWTLGSGSTTGELYLSKLEKKLLGVGDRIGSHSPLEGLI